jgi:class 3 adenylate cyclase
VVEPLPGGRCRAELSAYGSLKSLALRAIGPLVRAGLRRRIEAYFDAIVDVVSKADVELGDGPPAAEVAHLLWQRQQPVLSGGVTDTDTTELQRRAGHLQEMGVDDGVVARLTTILRDRPDEEVTQMRPFELADAWSADRPVVLRTFLHATSAGLVDLNWQVNCPVCKVAAGVVRNLAEVAEDIHCDACNIRYDVDFGTNVEAVFRCNEAIRDVQPTVYCAASPVFRPHVVAQIRVLPGAERTEMVGLGPGAWNFRTLGTQRSATVDVDEAPAQIEVRITSDRVEVASRGAAGDGSTEVVYHSLVDEPTFVLIERAGWSAPLALGSVVASLPEFVDLFATEAPAAGLELTIKRLTFFFSDLTGSTALYERIGDAKAYAVVQEHFRIMEQVIARHGGAIVKTMGDAVMATFSRPAPAVQAAIESVRTSLEDNERLGIGIKLGVHEGACLAVRANDRLDFFGTTVNVAARLQGKADTSELVVTRALAEDPTVGTLLRELSCRDFETGLKGISEAQTLRAYDLAAVASKPAGT